MNKHIYKSVWSSAHNTYVAVSENTFSSCKKSVHTSGTGDKHHENNSFPLAPFLKILSSGVKAFLATCGIAGLMHIPTNAASISWNHISEGNWLTNSHWNSGTAPTGSDAAIIGNGGTAVIQNGQTAGVASVHIGSGGEGTVKVEQGGILSSGQLFVGDNGKGTLVIDGGNVSAGVNNHADGYIGNTATGNGTIIVNNGGRLAISSFFLIGNYGTGKLIINDGHVSTVGWAVRVAEEAGSVGEIVVNGGFLQGSPGGNNFLIGRKGQGSLTVNNSGRVTSEWVFVGGEYINGVLQAQGGTGTVVLNDTSRFENNAGIVIGGKNSPGNITLNDNALMQTNKSLYVGYEGLGTITLNGGTVDSGSHIFIGLLSGSNGTITLTGGKLQARTNMAVGSAGTGTLTMSGGEVDVANQVIIGSSANSNGIVNISDGLMNVGGSLFVGNNGTGSLTMTGGQLSNTNELWLGYGTSGTGTVNLNGGTLQTNQISGQNGAAHLSFNGGVLKALRDNDTFIKQLTSFNIGANGGTIDSNSFDIGIASSITGPSNATLTKNGTGTLSIDASNSAYLGSVAVNAGTLALPVANTFINADAIALYGNGTIDTLGTQQTLNTLSGDTGTQVNTGSGELTLNNAAGKDSVYAGVITSTGTVNKTGAGKLTLDNNSSMGILSHTDGTLNIGVDKTITVNGTATVDGINTVLGVAAGNNPALIGNTVILSNTPTIDIIGYDPVNDTGSYTLVQTNGGITGSFHATVGGSPLSTFVTPDTYLIGSAFTDPSNHHILADVILVWNNTHANSAHGTFNITPGNSFTVGTDLTDKTGAALGFGWNGTTLTKKGDGTLILDGINTYTGLTDIQDGTLVVGSTSAMGSATIAGDVNVNANAILGGHGQILGDVHMFTGSTIAPGNSIGTITVGNITFDSGSTYEFEAHEDGSADKIIATGNATINGGSVSVLANGNIWKTTDIYNILNATGGVTGTFDDVSTNLAFLNPLLTYDANNVYLTFIRNSTGLGEIGLTPNQRETGQGIESLSPGNAIYDAITSMDAQSARNAYDNLSGEVHASVKSALLLNSRYPRAAVNQHLSGNSMTLNTQAVEPDSNLWSHAWGHDGYIKNDGNATRTDNKGGGILVGYDISTASTESIRTPARIGIAAGYEQTKINLGDMRDSSATVDAYHLMAYGATQAGPVDLRAGAGYAWLNIDTSRNIWIDNLQNTNKASYHGALAQLFVEGSHTFDLNEHAAFTPYANLAYTRIKTNGFDEAGNETALHNSSHTDAITTSTLGIKGQWQTGSQNQHTLYADLGWQHHFGNNTPEVRVNFANGKPFTIKGTEIGHDSVIIGLGARFQILPDMNLSVGYEGEYGSQVKDHAIKAQFQWRF